MSVNGLELKARVTVARRKKSIKAVSDPEIVNKPEEFNRKILSLFANQQLNAGDLSLCGRTRDSHAVNRQRKLRSSSEQPALRPGV